MGFALKQEVFVPRSAASDAALVVFITASSYEEANKLSSLIVESKLAACATIVENVRSLFKWEGKVNSEKESLLILKTTVGRFSDLEKFVKKHHSYEVPEIIAFPIVIGSKDYLKWIRQETQK
jgi:periplasmic divalent cation tolerance protein